MNDSNFDSSRLEHIRIEQTKLESANISQCRCRQVDWQELNDDNHELRGAAVDLYQAAELAKRLGIIIKD